jgi:uncharacterized membrane protein YfcA
VSGFFVVLIAALLSGMGVGSGGFYLLYLTDVLGVPQYTAQGANLVFFSIATLSSSLISLRGGRIVMPRLLPLLLFGALGTLLGTLATRLLPPESARMGLGLLLVISGLATLRTLLLEISRKRAKKRASPPEIP